MTGISVTKLSLGGLAITFFFTIIFMFISDIGSSGYDISNINNDSIAGFNDFNKTLNEINSVSEAIDDTAESDRALFDILGDILSRAFAPFKLVLSTISLIKENMVILANSLGISSIIIKYVLGAMTIFLFIGVFLFKVLLKTSDQGEL